MTYKRTIEPEIVKHIANNDELTILTGSRQVGKTTILKSIQRELESKHKHKTVYFTLERQEYRRILDNSPEDIYLIIPQTTYRQTVFIDEIQYLKDPTNFLKLIYDEYRDKIKLVVTGSSAFYIDRKFKDSLAGRKRIFHIRPFSFTELVESRGYDELLVYLNKGINNQVSIPLIQKEKLLQLAREYLVYGGYPRVALSLNFDEKQLILNELVSSFLKKDALESNIRKEGEFMFFTEILADRIGSRFNRQELGNVVGINDETVQNYMYILLKCFHVELIRPFWKSKTSELRKTPKFYFQDNGLRNAILHDFSPIDSRKDKGELTENFAFTLLRESYDLDNIQYWMTKDQTEVDFIINRQHAIEVKFSDSLIRESKYKLFQQTYPDIDFQFRCLLDKKNRAPLLYTL